MTVESCKSGYCSMGFGKTGGMSTATIAAKGTEGHATNRTGENTRRDARMGT